MFTNATLATIKSFLITNAADAGLASAMKFDGWNVSAVRTYAEQVQALRDAGYTAAITPRTVAAATQQVADERAAADAARAAAEATAAELMALVNEQVAAATTPRAKREHKTVNPSKGKVASLAALCNGAEEVYMNEEIALAAGLGVRWVRWSQGWQEGFVLHAAAMQVGYEVVSAGRKQVTLRRAA
jgi:hypothetical protein